MHNGDDKGTNGNEMERASPWFGDDEEYRIRSGENITMEMKTISEKVNDQFFLFKQGH